MKHGVIDGVDQNINLWKDYYKASPKNGDSFIFYLFDFHFSYRLN